jgi:N6-adenosine-specific RNA methylase IME4
MTVSDSARLARAPSRLPIAGGGNLSIIAPTPTKQTALFSGSTNMTVHDVDDRAHKQGLKRARRAMREQELAAKTIEAARSLGRELYAIILVDPPWSFRAYNDDTGQDRGAVNHYPVMCLEEIEALQIPAAKDAVLFLWATVPMLPQALETMAAWGFTYKSHFVWVKDKRGLGFWNRNRHELLLVGTRGNVPCPAPGEQSDSVIEAPRGRHSEKPMIVREMITAMFPNAPKLEMFARGQSVEGWELWGNEAPSIAAE